MLERGCEPHLWTAKHLEKSRRFCPVNRHGVTARWSRSPAPSLFLSHLQSLSLSSLKKEAEAGRRFTYCLCLVRDATTLSPHLQTSSPLLYILLTPADVSHIYLKKRHFANECFYAYFCPLGAILSQIVSLHHSNYSDRYYSYMQNPTTSHSLHSYYPSSSTLFKYHCLTT